MFITDIRVLTDEEKSAKSEKVINGKEKSSPNARFLCFMLVRGE